jgi:hypothetical protein
VLANQRILLHLGIHCVAKVQDYVDRLCKINVSCDAVVRSVNQSVRKLQNDLLLGMGSMWGWVFLPIDYYLLWTKQMIMLLLMFLHFCEIQY